MRMMANPIVQPGLTFIPEDESWKNLIRPAPPMGIGASFLLLLLLALCFFAIQKQLIVSNLIIFKKWNYFNLFKKKNHFKVSQTIEPLNQ